MSRHESLRLRLLDVQIVDSDRLPVGRVDDVELEIGEGRARVEKLLTGSAALGERIGGVGGRALTASSDRLREERPKRPGLDPALVTETLPMIRLSAAFSELPDLAGLERWLARNLVGRIPGAGDAPR